MLATFSIRSKITAVVIFLLLAMTGMGGLAIKQMNDINNSTVDIVTNWLPSVRALGSMRAELLGYRSIVRSHMLAVGDAEKKAQDALLVQYNEMLTTTRKNYEAVISSREEQALYNEFRKHSDEYFAIIEKVLDYSRKNMLDEARELNRNAAPIGVKADEALQKDVELNNTGAGAAGDKAAADFSSALKIVIGAIVLSAIAGIVAATLLIRDVSSGIQSIVSPMQALGNGDLTANVPHQGKSTEIGRMADTLQVFKQALIDKRTADQAAVADADTKIERGRRVDSITREFEALIGEIVNTVSSASTELEASATSLTTVADRSQQIAVVVAAASEEASTNVQSVASATEEMASTVNEIGRQVQESARIANNAVDQAKATNDRVAELSTAAARIGDVVELIATIAGQTNLLALNATIEAARAGDAGRGFAVVASEVKALAEQTAKATSEISQQIASIQNATGLSVIAIKEIGTTIGKMSEIASTIAAAVEEQGAATQEIARNVQQAAQGTMQVSANIVDVQRGTSETGSASSQVLSAAQSLSQDSNRLKLEVGRFLSTVRAA